MTKVAIIEDDTIISQMYRMKLESDGFEVQLASNGEQGIALGEAFKPDLILLDMKMPGMNGVDTLKIIRSSDWGKNTPVIILTNMEEDDSTQELDSLGVSSYIIKANTKPKEVVEIIKKTL